MKPSQALAKRLQTIMAEKGVTKETLIKNCALSPSTVDSVLKAKNENVNISTIFEFARAFDMSLSEFFGNEVFNLQNLD